MKWFVFSLISIVPLTAAAADPYEDKQWYLDQINAKPAWNLTLGNPEIVVAVLDTGVDLDHPDLEENIWSNPGEIAADGIDNDQNGYIDDVNGWDFVYDRPSPAPYLDFGYAPEAVKHGTFVAGLIAAVHDNNVGIKGVAGRVRIMPLVVLNASGYGNSTSVSSAIHYAVDNGADIINLSFGGDEHYSALKNAIVRAYENNVTVVAAAGNGLTGGNDLAVNPVYPICYDREWSLDSIIGVASLDQENRLSTFSNYGGGCIDLSAPGNDITSLSYYTGESLDFNELVQEGDAGTSFSTALVTGTVALMKSVNPLLSNAQVAEILRSSATNVANENTLPSGSWGAGLLNTEAAVTKTYNDYNLFERLNIFVSSENSYPGSIFQYGVSFRSVGEIKTFSETPVGVNLSSADVDFDGNTDMVVGLKSGSLPLVRVIGSSGELLASFLAFDPQFEGGVKVAAGDLLDDELLEYAVIAEENQKPLVRLFNSSGQKLLEFSAYSSASVNGMSIAVGNVMGDAKDEIVVGAPRGSKPEVRIFDSQGKLLKTIMAYAPTFTGGVNVALGDLSGDKSLEIVTGAGFGGGPHVRAFSSDGALRADFFAYASKFRGGVKVAVGDFDNDGQNDIITAPGKTGGPHVKIFGLDSTLKGEFFALPASYTGGIQIAVTNN